MKELHRLQVLTRIAERHLTRRRAAALLQIGERQVRRLYRAFIQDAAWGEPAHARGPPDGAAAHVPGARRGERVAALAVASPAARTLRLGRHAAPELTQP